MNRLEGRVALVTGGLKGIGRAVVERLLEEGAGVMIADLATAEAASAEVAGLGGRAGYVELDVGDEAAWPGAIAAIMGRFGRLDILVANAGTAGTGRVQDVTLEQWHATMRVNVDGVFLSTRFCADLLAASGRTGGAVPRSSTSPRSWGWCGLPHVSAYNASKGRGDPVHQVHGAELCGGEAADPRQLGASAVSSRRRC
jgi:NAD(P)-dependent dehydrogenase (short-subunit alcohol dehydrogenase family)